MKVLGLLGRLFGGVVLLLTALVVLVYLVGSQGMVVLSEEKSLVAIGNPTDDEMGEFRGEVLGADSRAEIIKRYLARYKSPLLAEADLILELADKYGFEYYWILAIGQQESNLCKKIPEESFNCWGYGINSAGTLRFDSYAAALQSFAEYLDREYFKKGLDTAELMMKKYCPHSNGSWAWGINHFIEEIESGSFDRG